MSFRVYVCVSERDRRRRRRRRRERENRRELELPSRLTGRIKKTFKIVRNPSYPPSRTALPFWKSLYFYHYFKYTYLVSGFLCLARCGCFVLPTFACIFRHHQNTATSPSVAAADSPAVLCMQLPSLTAAISHTSRCSCSSVPARGHQLFSAIRSLHISSLENKLPQAWIPPRAKFPRNWDSYYNKYTLSA